MLVVSFKKNQNWARSITQMRLAKDFSAVREGLEVPLIYEVKVAINIVECHGIRIR